MLDYQRGGTTAPAGPAAVHMTPTGPGLGDEDMQTPSWLPKGLELCCLSILVGECVGVIYVLGNLVMRVFHWW